MTPRAPRLAAGPALAALLVLGGAAAAGTGPAGAPAGPPGGVPLTNAGGPAPGLHGIIDVEEAMAVDCGSGQLTGPAATSTAHVTGTPEKVRLDVQVVVDVADGARIAQIIDPERRASEQAALFAKVAKSLEVGKQSYAPLGLELRYERFALLQPLVDGKPRQRTDNAQTIINLTKAQFGGVRPAGTDVVYTVTDIDIQLPGLGKAVAGLADCIGGVANPDRAFAVGETGVLVGDEGLPFGPVTFYKDLTAKIAAHEVGHLMGGHHHYQECATPSPSTTAVGRGELGPCTLMTNAVDFQTMPFSTLNGIVVRGHAEQFARATDAPPAG